MGYGIASDNRAAKRPLGIVTKKSATFPDQVTFDPATGEITDRSPSRHGLSDGLSSPW